MANIDVIDLSNNKFILNPMNLTDDIETLMTNVVSNITHDKQTFEDTNTEVQGKMNEVINLLNTFTDGAAIDLVALQNKINAIILLQSEAGSTSFVGLFSKLYTELNTRKDTLIHNILVESTVTGSVVVDVTQFGFKNVESFDLVPTVLTPTTRVSTAITVEKISKTTVKLTIRNLGYIQSVNVPESFYNPLGTNKDGTVNGSLNVMLTIIKVPKPISAEVTEVDGDKTIIGTPSIPQAVITSAVVDPTSGILTIIGTKGTEANTVITVINSDVNSVFNVVSVDGEDAFTITSTSAVLLNSSLEVHKVVDGVASYDVLVPYSSIYPQIDESMMVLSSTGVMTFTSASLATGVLNVTLDGTALTAVTLDGSGIGSISDQIAITANGSEHTIVFTVTLVGKQSMSASKTFTITGNGNNTVI